MPYAHSDSFVNMPVSRMQTMLYRDRTRNTALELFGILSSSCELHLARCVPCCARALSKVRVHLSKFVHTTAVLRRRNSQSDCRHGSNRVCRSKPQRQPALFTRCKGVCSTLSRPWQPKQSKSSSFMIMNRTSGTDLRCLAEPQHH